MCGDVLAYQSNLPMSSSVSLRLAEVERLRRQRDKLNMLLKRAQLSLLADLEALRAMRAQESSWWRALDHGEQVSHLRHASAVLGKEAHDFQISAALSVLRRDRVLTQRSSGRRAVASRTSCTWWAPALPGS